MDTVRREKTIERQVPAPIGKDRKLYAEAARSEGRREKCYKLLISSRTDHSVEAIKNIIKTNVNPTSMKVGICALKSLRDGRVLMETKSKEEIKLLHSDINEKCSQLLEVNVQKPRNPKLVIYNITEEVTVENAEEIITTQNPELTLNAEEIKPKFVYKGKRDTKNLVIEVDPQTQQKIFNTKLKIGWHIYNTRDYIVVNKCFKCSRYNHRSQ
jgi:hypothetical protein